MKTLLILIISNLFIVTAMAQKKNIITPPPLIDREIFFGNPEISGAQLSPDGKMISFIKPYNGIRNIWVKKTSEPFDKAKPLTNDQRPIANYFWSRNSKYLLYVQDKGGNENYQLFAVNPMDKPVLPGNVPPGRNLSNKENSMVQIVHISRSNSDLIYIAINDRDASWHDLYELKISTGELKLLTKNTDRYTNWIFDQKDKLRLLVRSNTNGSTDLLRIDQNTITTIYSGSVLEEFYPINFHSDGNNVYLISNVGIKRNFSELVLFDIYKLKETVIESDPKNKVDIDNAIFSELDNSLLYTSYTDDKVRTYWKNKLLSKDFNMLKKQFKKYEIGIQSNTRDENLWLISVYSDVDPGSVYLFDRRTKKTAFQYRPRPKMPINDLASMKIITYKSSDGLVIPAYLTLPKNSSEKNLPLIVNPHGGPWARDRWGYNSYAQFLANRGYAVLQMNFRGSTGYGKKFIDAGNLEWGKLMQDDITYGVNYLVKKGIADPMHVGIFGGSYGGYATLAGLTFTPELYACGVSIVGPSSLLTLLESIPPYWEAGRKIFHIRMGDPTNADGYSQLKKQSPLYSIDKIKAALMVVQGANDPRVKKSESDQIVIAMRDKNLPVDYLCALDEGHGFANPVNNMAFLAAAEKFLANHLHGRYQESMSAEIENKLKELTVNIQSLKTNKPTTLPTAKINSISSHDLEEGKFVYKSSTKFLGEPAVGKEEIEISSKGSDWIIKSSRELPIGTIYDNGKIKKSGLVNFTRDLESSGLLYQIGYTDNQISVRKTENGKKSSFKIKVPELCFADGPIASVLIACLPLTDTFKREIINLNLEKAIPIKRLIEVKAIETIDGTDCFKVEVKRLDSNKVDMIVWVSISDKPKTIKYLIDDPLLAEEPIVFTLSNNE